MNRRGFLSILTRSAAAVAVGVELDLDKLLWVPGTKKIFLPPTMRMATLAEIDALTTSYLNSRLLDVIFRESPVFARFKSGLRVEFRG